MDGNQKEDYFKWQIAIFDDVPNEYDKCSVEQHFDIEWFDSLSKILENTTAIRNSHIAIIDMNWSEGGCLKLEGNKGERLFVPTREEMRNMNPSEIARQWVYAIGAWASDLDHEDSRPKRLPANRIGPKEVGAWIGAMLSWVAPSTIPVFLTGYKDHFEKGIQAPLSLFLTAPFAVNYKSTSSTTSKERIEGKEFWRALQKRQIELLRNLEVRNWFFSKVLINRLCGKDYESEVCSVYFEGSGSVEEVVMEFNHVFPNLRDSSPNEVIAEIRQCFEATELSDSDYIAIFAVKHALSRNAEPGKKDIQEAYQYALSVGGWCDGVRKQLERIIQLKEESSNPAIAEGEVQSCMKRALNLIDAVCVNCKNALQDLGSQRSEWTVSLLRKGPRVVASQRDVDDLSSEPGLRLRRFPVQWLRDILLHLLDNADKLECKWAGEARELSRGNDSFFVFSFSSEWKGELSWRIFWETARKSNKEKGEYRGLPVVIRRGVESGADALFIKTGNECRFVWADDGLDALKADILDKEQDFQFVLVYKIEKQRKKYEF